MIAARGDAEPSGRKKARPARAPWNYDEIPIAAWSGLTATPKPAEAKGETGEILRNRKKIVAWSRLTAAMAERDSVVWAPT